MGWDSSVSTRDTNTAPLVTDAAANTRATATSLMSEALALIDADPTISGIVGAQLQMAIDSLWKGSLPPSRDLN